jgi:proteasome beta subunit
VVPTERIRNVLVLGHTGTGKSTLVEAMLRVAGVGSVHGAERSPLFAGVDPRTREGSIYEYDPDGGRYQARDHAATGSGSLAARATLKRLHRDAGDLDLGGAVRTAVEALFDAAEEDSATGGPDLIRRIYPIAATIDEQHGNQELSDDGVLAHVEAVIERRQR